jgi:hypothetical protein
MKKDNKEIPLITLLQQEIDREKKDKCKKVAFGSKGFADVYIKKLNAISTRAKVPVRSYLCHCGVWHLTSLPISLEAELISHQEKNEILNELTEQLKKQIKSINLNKTSSKEKIVIKSDERVIELQKGIKNKSEQLKSLRETVEVLIIKNNQLQNIIDKLTEPKT